MCSYHTNAGNGDRGEVEERAGRGHDEHRKATPGHGAGPGAPGSVSGRPWGGLRFRPLRWQVAIPVFITFICLTGLLLLVHLQWDGMRSNWEREERTRLLDLLMAHRSNLETELYSRIFYTRSVAAYVSLNPNIEDGEYDNLARELIRNDPVISTMALARDAVIHAVYPLRGHEAAIGLDLMAHPERRQIVESTIATGRTYVAGPVELVEGGITFISYTPIFDRTVEGEAPFWGMTDVVILKDPLLDAANLMELRANARFALRGIDGKGWEGAVFFGEERVFEMDPVTVSVRLPTGEWILAAIPEGGWESFFDQDAIFLRLLIFASILLAVFVGLFSAAILHIRSEARQMASIFRATTSPVLEVDREGVIRWVAPVRSGGSPFPPVLNEGESVPGWVGSGGAGVLRDALQRCLASGQVTQCELRMESEKPPLWLEVSLSPKSEQRAIAVLKDITLPKTQQLKLAESAEHLRRVNADKDRLFSIIGHDLRGSLGNIVSLSQTLLDEENRASPDERRELLQLIRESGRQTHFLLDNLLSWASWQQDGMTLAEVKIDLEEELNSLRDGFNEIARSKSVRIDLRFHGQREIRVDRHLLQTVLRNLLSNAIKYSHPGGTVEILADTEDTPGMCVFKVSDQGIGMDPEMIIRILKADRLTSRVGTSKEAGTGFGLSLCRDLLTRMGSSLSIESAEGEGTVVSFAVSVSGTTDTRLA